MIKITYLLTFIFCFIIGGLACLALKVFKLKIKAKFKDTAVTFFLASAITAFAFVVIEFIVNKFTLSGGGDLVAVAAFVELVEMLMLLSWATDNKTVKPMRKIFFIAVALALCEIFVFNLKSFSSSPQSATFDLSTIAIKNENAEFQEDRIVMKADSTLSIENLPSWTRGITVVQEQPDEANTRPFQVSIGLQDGNARKNFDVVQDKISMGNRKKPLTFTITPYQQAYVVELRYTKVAKPIEIFSVSVCNALPFDFSFIRYFVLFVILSSIVAVNAFHLEKVSYKSNKVSHRLIVQAVIVLCTMSSVLFLYTGELKLDYNPDVVNTIDPYSATLDAFKKGQVYLDLKPEEGLNDLENVYDRSERDGSGIFYFWDFALYENHYYSYFGVAPVITFYLPYHLITGGVPDLALAVFFFGALSILFFCELLVKIIDILVKKPSLLLLILLIPTATSLMGTYYCINLPSKYTLPVVAGLCYLFLCLWTGICATTAKNKIIRFVLFFVSGLSLACCVASRPGIALGALIIAPFYLQVLLDKKSSIIYRIGQATTFLVPVFVGVALVLYYNSLRFSSPFDFGQTYQLTVSDIHANKLSLSGFFPMLYHYFLQMPRARSVFPFYEPSFYVLYNYGKYTYLENCLSALTYPFIVAGFVALPSVCSDTLTNRGEKTVYLVRKYFVLLCFAFSFIIAWQDFCMGGAITRYVMDIMPLLVIGSSVALMHYTRAENNTPTKMNLFVISMAVSFSITWLVTVSTNDGTIMNRCSTLYEQLEDLLIFWQ